MRTALIRNEPRIDVLRVAARLDPQKPEELVIEVEYRVRRTDTISNLVYPFYLDRGELLMPVRPPTLDDRSLPQLVQQLLGAADDAFGAAAALGIERWRLAQHFSEQRVRDLLARPFDDPGLMLALIFARLLDLALQRLNQVPEKNLLAFLDAMGVGPAPAVAGAGAADLRTDARHGTDSRSAGHASRHPGKRAARRRSCSRPRMI